MTSWHGGYQNFNLNSSCRVPSFDFVPACKYFSFIPTARAHCFSFLFVSWCTFWYSKAPPKDHLFHSAVDHRFYCLHRHSLSWGAFALGQKRRPSTLTFYMRPATAFITSIGIHCIASIGILCRHVRPSICFVRRYVESSTRNLSGLSPSFFVVACQNYQSSQSSKTSEI